MRQRRDRQGLALEPRQGIRIRRERLRQHLDRHLALQLRIPRPVHLSHPARAQRRDDLVGPEARSGRQRHLAARDELLEPRVLAQRDRSWGRSSASRARGSTGSSAAARAGRAPSPARRRACRSARAGAGSTGRCTASFETGASATPRSPSRIASSFRPEVRQRQAEEAVTLGVIGRRAKLLLEGLPRLLGVGAYVCRVALQAHRPERGRGPRSPRSSSNALGVSRSRSSRCSSSSTQTRSQ